MACLEILTGSRAGQCFPLAEVVTIGRTPDNDLCLPAPQVSRRHACIRRQGDTFVIEDLHSTNGVLVQGRCITPGAPCCLADGDEITIGAIRLRLHTAETPPDLDAKAQEASPPHQTPPMFSPAVAVSLDAAESVIGVLTPQMLEEQNLREVIRRLQVMCRVSTTLGTILNRDQLMQRITDCLFEIFPLAERIFIVLGSSAEASLTPVAARTRHGSPEHLRGTFSLSRTIVQEVLGHKRAILSVDARNDARFHDRESIVGLSIRSMMCTPLLHAEEVLGLIQVDTYSGCQTFTEDDLQILTGISAQVAIVVKNMQLYEAVEREVTRRASLQRYFSPVVVDMLMSGDLTTALGGHVYQGTVLFADIIGFTSLSEALPPALVVSLLNRFFRLAQQAIHERGGSVDKLSGDAMLAFWGVPQAQHDDAHRAVLAALQIQQGLWAHNRTLRAQGLRPIYAGIGMNTGEFVAGNIGSANKIEFTLIENTINIAARIEHLASRYQVLIAKTTWEAIKHAASAIALPPVEVKGASQALQLYVVRMLQDPYEGGYVLALPGCLRNAHGEVVAHLMLTGCHHTQEHLQLFCHVDTALPTGTRLVLQCNLPEYHLPFTLDVTVTSAVTMHDSEGGHTRAVLIPHHEDPSFFSLLTPTTCLPTSRPWCTLQRH